MRSQIKAAAALIVALAVTVAACSGGDDDATDQALADLLDELDVSVPEDIDLGEYVGEDIDLGEVTDADDFERLIEEESGGEVVAEISDGMLSVEPADERRSDENDADVFEAPPEFPEDWPEDVPRPEGIDMQSSVDTEGSADFTAGVSGAVDQSPTEWADAYLALLVDAGFTEQERFGSENDVSAVYESEAWTIRVLASRIDTTAVTTPIEGETIVAVTATPVG